METKVCTKCKVEKPVSEFYFIKSKNKPQCACIECSLISSRASNLKKRNSRPKRVIQNLEGEIWVPVIGFEDKYRVSNLGRVKSIDRWVYRELVGKDVFMEGKLLSQSYHPQEKYQSVTLYGATTKDKSPTVVYKIVFFSFNLHVEKRQGWHIDHIDQDRTNTMLDNLQYIPERENYIKRSLHKKGSSKYAGVS